MSTEIRFKARGHKNILATHKTTLEFTKDSELTKKGDCIVGVKADFDVKELKRFLKCERIRIKLTVDAITEELDFKPNPDFDHKTEMVIRTTDFNSERTFGVMSKKAAKNISRKMIDLLKNPEKTLKISISDE